MFYQLGLGYVLVQLEAMFENPRVFSTLVFMSVTVVGILVTLKGILYTVNVYVVSAQVVTSRVPNNSRNIVNVIREQ